MEVAWENYSPPGKHMPDKEVIKKSVEMCTPGIADTGCSVLCGGLETLRKMRIQRGTLMKSGITLKTADGKPLTVLGAIPVTVTVMESRENTVTEFLHIILELSALYLSKNCLKELNILSKSFPLPCHNPESIQALDSTPSQKEAPCVQFKKKKTFLPPLP